MAFMKPVASTALPRPRSASGTEPAVATLERMPFAIDLLPIPAASLSFRGGRFSIEASNSAFQAAGLGATADQSPLIASIGDRIAAFVDGKSLRDEFRWQLGDAVEGRHFVVTLARTARDDSGR